MCVGLAVDGDTTGRDIRVIKKSGKVQALKEAIQSTLCAFRPRPCMAALDPLHTGSSLGRARVCVLSAPNRAWSSLGPSPHGVGSSLNAVARMTHA